MTDARSDAACVLPENVSTVSVVTHGGRFHADEVVAYAILQVAGLNTRLSRISRSNAQAIAAADICLDIGLVHDPDHGRFDHHQPGGAGSRQVGRVNIPYATAGLVWQCLGPTVCGGDMHLVHTIDRRFIAYVDAVDNGVGHLLPSGELVHPAEVIAQANADNPRDHGEQMRLFLAEVAKVCDLLRNFLRNARRALSQLQVVQNAIRPYAEAGKPVPRVLQLEKQIDWRDRQTLKLLSSHSVDVLLMPHGNGVVVHVVSAQYKFPDSWRMPMPGTMTQLAGTEDVVITNGHHARTPDFESAGQLARNFVNIAPHSVACRS